MIVLAVETVTGAGSVALRQQDRVVSTSWPTGVPHAVRLPGAVTEWLATHGLSLADVTHLAVVSGPGSFTGVRIGMACVQGLAVTRGLPTAAVSTLDALAEGWRATEGPTTPGACTVMACLDGRRGEVFTARYHWDGATLGAGTPPQVGPPSGVGMPHVEGPVIVVGDGAVAYDGLWQDAGCVTMAACEPLAAGAARVAGTPGRPFVGPHALHPVYVRRPDVELARERRQSTE